MKKLLLALMLFFFCFGEGFAEAAEWTGLWRVTRVYNDHTDGTYHFHFIQQSAGRLDVVVYADDARPMILQRFDPGDEKLEVQVANSAKQPLPLLFTLQLSNGETLEGEWMFSQMQLTVPLTGAVVGRRVLGSDDWTPWPFLEGLRQQKGPWVDLAGPLSRAAAKKDFKDFVRFWNEQIEPRYYFVVQGWVYGDGLDNNHKEMRLRDLFKQLVQPETGGAAVKEFPTLAEWWLRKRASVRDQGIPYLVSLPPAQQDGNELLLWTRIPTPLEEASCACKLDLRESFRLIDPGIETVREEIDRFTPVFWEREPASLGVELFRRGLMLHLALQRREMEWADEGPLEADSWANKLKQELLQPVESLESYFPPGEASMGRTPGWVLGFRFVQAELLSSSVEQLFQLQDREVISRWMAYLEKQQSSSTASDSRP